MSTDYKYKFDIGEKIIENYEILRHLKQDASGELYLVRDITKRPFLLKVCNGNQEREIVKLLADQIDAKGILPVVDHGMVDDSFYYLMTAPDNLVLFPEYEPSTLSNMMKRQKRMSPWELCEIGKALLKGVQGFNAVGFRHGAICPTNIFFFDGHPMLGNFTNAEKLADGKGNDDVVRIAKILYCAYSGNSEHDFPNPPDIDAPEFLKKTESLRLCLARAGSQEGMTPKDFADALANAQKRQKDTRYLLRKFRIFMTVIIGIVALLCWRGILVEKHRDQDIKDRLAEVDAPILATHQQDNEILDDEILQNFAFDLNQRIVIHEYADAVLSDKSDRNTKEENLSKFNNAYKQWMQGRSAIRQHFQNSATK